jgi:hypothetical protein
MEHNYMHEQVEHNPEFNKWWEDWLCAIARRRGELGPAPNASNCDSTLYESGAPTRPQHIERVM